MHFNLAFDLLISAIWLTPDSEVLGHSIALLINDRLTKKPNSKVLDFFFHSLYWLINEYYIIVHGCATQLVINMGVFESMWAQVFHVAQKREKRRGKKKKEKEYHIIFKWHKPRNFMLNIICSIIINRSWKWGLHVIHLQLGTPVSPPTKFSHL